jgi:hypothetical protein
MAWSWSGRRCRNVALVATVVAARAVLPAAADQSVLPPDRDALVRVHVERGGRASDVEALIRLADEAASRGLPAEPLVNKIREGLAKKADPDRIGLRVRQMTAYLEAADRLVRELPAAAAATERTAAVTLLAEAFEGGLTGDEVRALQAGPQAMPAVTLASAAKGLSFIKGARLSVADGTAVVVEASRRGFRDHEMLDLGREIKRREHDYQSGRASLRALRDAIARGDRPDQLFRDGRHDAVERPSPARPESPPDRPARPDVPVRPERPARPDLPERPGTAR